jgi:hypothetical protein
VHTLSPDGHLGKVPANIHFSNILGYLGNTLPPLDAEVGSTPPPDDTGALPLVFQVNGERHALRASFLCLTHATISIFLTS